MANADNEGLDRASVPECECGYRCVGASPADRIRDAQRHAREAHGIDVTADQVLASDAFDHQRKGAS